MSTTPSAEITEEAAAAEQRADPQGLSAWVQKLGESGMPVFAHTARDISHISDSRDSSAAELARVVLQDAAMTAKLLRVANSPAFNPMGKSISTVSRAVVVLGFQEVRAICLSIAVVESMLKGKQKEHVIEEMARSFHAAVQARSFAKKRKDKSPEEVFIASLLYHLGDMAFWAFAGESAEQLDSALRTRTGQAPDSVQREVLGFVFRDLTLGLSKEWKLGELLEQSLQGKTDKNPRAGNVALGYEMAIAAEKGWKSPEVNQLVERIAENLYLPVEQVSKMIKANAEEAADTATFYGAVKASSLIPVPGNKSETAEGEDVPTEEAVQAFIEPDPMLQLQILRELSALMESKPDFNSVLEMVLEGMYRGIGMDRTLFALRSPDNRFLMGRYALGTDNEILRGKFQFETVAGKPNLFSRVVDTRQAIWLSESNRADLRALITEQVTEVTCGAEFYVTPIEVHNKVIGLFYADRQPSGRALDEEGFNSFRHFAQQGNLALAFLSGK